MSYGHARNDPKTYIDYFFYFLSIIEMVKRNQMRNIQPQRWIHFDRVKIHYTSFLRSDLFFLLISSFLVFKFRYQIKSSNSRVSSKSRCQPTLSLCETVDCERETQNNLRSSPNKYYDSVDYTYVRTKIGVFICLSIVSFFFLFLSPRSFSTCFLAVSFFPLSHSLSLSLHLCFSTSIFVVHCIDIALVSGCQTHHTLP